jgi:hypothetical protein
MKKITFFALLLTITLGYSQTNVTVDPNENWVGFMNVFNAADDTFAFNFSYPVNQVKTTITESSITLQPNFAIWSAEANNAAWFDNPGNPPSNPNKKTEGTTFVEDNNLVGEAVDFTGTVDAVTIDPSYTVSALDRKSTRLNSSH